MLESNRTNKSASHNHTHTLTNGQSETHQTLDANHDSIEPLHEGTHLKSAHSALRDKKTNKRISGRMEGKTNKQDKREHKHAQHTIGT